MFLYEIIQRLNSGNYKSRSLRVAGKGNLVVPGTRFLDSKREHLRIIKK